MPWHTLIVDDSRAISVHKMLVLYLVQAIAHFYSKHDLTCKKMVMPTSDGASVMLGKHNGVAALFKR